MAGRGHIKSYIIYIIYNVCVRRLQLGADNYEINSDFMRQGSLGESGGDRLLLHSAHSATTAAVCAPGAEYEPTTDTTKTSATALQHTLAYKKADGVCGSP